MAFTGDANTFGVVRAVECSTVLLPVVNTLSVPLNLDDAAMLKEAATCLRDCTTVCETRTPAPSRLGFRKRFSDMVETHPMAQVRALSLSQILCGLPREVFDYIGTPWPSARMLPPLRAPLSLPSCPGLRAIFLSSPSLLPISAA
eukprot:2241421-Rhodomonas_salina.4